MPTESSTASLRRIESSEVRSSIDLSVCEGAPTSALIFMSGELSASTIDEVVWNSVMEFAAFAHSVVVDLTHADRVDERGAEMVEALYRVVDGVGGQLSLHNPNCVVEHVLRFCGISDRIVICQPTTPSTTPDDHGVRNGSRSSNARPVDRGAGGRRVEGRR